MKHCYNCQQVKPLTDFYHFKGKPKTPCKKCRTILSLQWAQKNPEKRKANWQRSASVRRDDHREQSLNYVQRHPERRRESVKKYNDNNKEKRRARSRVAYALQIGTLKRLPCVKCGAVKSQAHHEDYSKPLLVRWLCAKCHGLEHRT